VRTLLPLPLVTPAAPVTTALGAWVDEAAAKKTARKPRKRTARSPKGYEAACTEAEARAKANDWKDAEPRHLVGLYALLHRQVYKVPPAELADVWKGAVSAARSMLDKEFKGDVSAFVEFIRWTWIRERRSEERAVVDGNERRRLGWALQFKAKSLLTDYRVDMARAQEAANPRGKR
jgi:hypothetical protein